MRKTLLFISFLLFFALAACAKQEVTLVENCSEVVDVKHYKDTIGGIIIGMSEPYLVLKNGKKVWADRFDAYGALANFRRWGKAEYCTYNWVPVKK